MKARRSSEQAFFDVFADMSIEEQEIALKLMAYEHHQAIRRERRRRAERQESAAAQQPVALATKTVTA
jgi:hypothetical protein